MLCNLEGKVVNAMYLGDIPCEGVVRRSLVQYGGEIGHFSDVTAPVKIGQRVETEGLMIEHKFITKVRDSI